MPCSTFQRQNPARTRRPTGSADAALDRKYLSSPVWGLPAQISHMALQLGAGLGEGPAVVLEELLQGAGGDAGGQGDGLAGLARQVGEQACAVDAQQVERLGVVTAEEELLQVVGEGRPELLDLFRRHGN